MQDKVLKDQVEQTQKIIEQSQEWQKTYDNLASVMLSNRSLVEEFYKTCKEYEHIQFYLTEVITDTSTMKITVKYLGQPIAKVVLTKDKDTSITTEEFNESNKKNFECKIQLKDEDWNSEKTKEFIEYFREDIVIKNKGNERSRVESLLLAEFAKTSSYDKLLTGIQPIKYENIFFPLPVIIDKTGTEHINILTRTKVRKLTLLEYMDESQDQEKVLAQATAKALFLINLLHSESKDKWYKLMGFHGRVPRNITVKVCVVANKKLATKCKEFQPFQIQCNIDTLEYHYMHYEEKENEISSIKTSINE